MRTLTCFLLLTALATAEPYTFTLNGKAVEPVSRQKQPLGPGDVVELYPYAFRLDEPGEYRLETRKGEPQRVYRETVRGTHVFVAGVEQTYVKEKPVIQDGLRGLTPQEAAHLRGVYVDHQSRAVWAELEALKPFDAVWVLKPGLDDDRKVPALPSGVQYLLLRQTMSPSWSDWSSLGRFSTLRYLRADLMEPQFSPEALGTHQNLQFLSVDQWKDARGLERFGKLQTLHINGVALPDLGFVRAMPELRELEVRHAGLTNLEPLAGHPALRHVEAPFNPVASLPTQPWPVVQRVNVLGSRLSNDQAQAFRAAHPQATLTWNHQETLMEKLRLADKLRVRSGGTCHRDPSREKTLVEVTDRAQLGVLTGQMTVREPEDSLSCMCCGEPTFEFYSEGKLLTSVGFHHGQLLRWSDGWESDCQLTAQSATALVDWLANQGLEGPKTSLQVAEQRRAAARAELKRLTRDYPPALQAAFEAEEMSPRTLQAAYESSFPAAQQRVLALFQALGTSPRSWDDDSGFSAWLMEYTNGHGAEPIQAAMTSGLTSGNDRTRRGAVRYWITGPYQKWAPTDPQAYPAALDLMQDSPSKQVRQLALESALRWRRAGALKPDIASRSIEFALSDPYVKVRQDAIRAAGLYCPALHPRLLQTAGGQKLSLRPERPLAPDEQDDTVTYYTSSHQDWEAAALALGWARYAPARTVLLKRPATPDRELALALLGESARLRKAHFVGVSSEAAVEAVLRGKGRHGLEWAIQSPGDQVGKLKALLLARNPSGAEQLRAVRSAAQLQAWWRKHGRSWRG